MHFAVKAALLANHVTRRGDVMDCMRYRCKTNGKSASVGKPTICSICIPEYVQNDPTLVYTRPKEANTTYPFYAHTNSWFLHIKIL